MPVEPSERRIGSSRTVIHGLAYTSRDPRVSTSLSLLQRGSPPTVSEVDDQPEDGPDAEGEPRHRRQAGDQQDAQPEAQQRDQRYQRSAEAARQIRARAA